MAIRPARSPPTVLPLAPLVALLRCEWVTPTRSASPRRLRSRSASREGSSLASGRTVRRVERVVTRSRCSRTEARTCRKADVSWSGAASGDDSDAETLDRDRAGLPWRRHRSANGYGRLIPHRLLELPELLGVSRATAQRYSKRADFPEPLDRPRSGPIWEQRAVERWAAEHMPLRRGRPPRGR